MFIKSNAVDYAKSSLLTTSGLSSELSGCSFLSFFLNKKSPVSVDLDLFVFLIYPSISAPFSVFKLFPNSISPLTVPVEPITTSCPETFPSK